MIRSDTPSWMIVTYTDAHQHVNWNRSLQLLWGHWVHDSIGPCPMRADFTRSLAAFDLAYPEHGIFELIRNRVGDDLYETSFPLLKELCSSAVFDREADFYAHRMVVSQADLAKLKLICRSYG